MLSADWYRFVGAAGNQMAESCVDNSHCGAYYSGWLNGSHPTVNEGAVQRRVCFRYYDNCCDFPTYIRVRNCGGFYVYQLKPFIVCQSRYCGNGYVSSTPTTPGTRFPCFFFSCFNVLFVLRITHLALIDEMNKEHIGSLQMVKLNGSYSIATLPPPPPTNQPSSGRIHSQPLTTTVCLKYWFSVLKTLSELKIFNLHH